MEKTVWDIALFERLSVTDDLAAVRVPGGWIFYTWDYDESVDTNPVFVPYVTRPELMKKI